MAHPLVRRCLISLSAPFACHWYSRGDNGQNLDFGSLYYDWHRCYRVGIRIAIVIKVSYYNEIPLPICSSRMLNLRCGVRINFPYHWINPKFLRRRSMIILNRYPFKHCHQSAESVPTLDHARRHLLDGEVRMCGLRS